ncbi:MAG: DUF2934 domain-containing protein [Alphaproteobacteria bacterium]|jgi:hypothetical protein|nr:DUF2934 domain-containing protein [Alphaproteobacteria bacterium]
MTPRELHDRISQLAYLMWEAAGRQQGLAMEYWLAAERQVITMVGTAMGTAMDQMLAPCRAAAQPHRRTESKAPPPATEDKPAAVPEAAVTERTPEPAAASEPPAPEPAAPAAPAPASSAEPVSAEPAAAVQPAPSPPPAEPAPVRAEPVAPPAEAVASPEPAPALQPEPKAAGNGELVEHRNRPIVRRDWIGRNVMLDLDTTSGHYRVPHDALWDFVKSHKTVESTKTWQQKGEYSWPKIPHDLLEFLSPYARD